MGRVPRRVPGAAPRRIPGATPRRAPGATPGVVRLKATLAVAALLCAAPLLALVLLLLSGAASAGPAWLAMAGVAAAGVALALVWSRDLHRAAAALRVAAGGDVPATRPAATAPRLPGLAALTREAERLLRAQASRAASAEAGRRAERAVLEALPDPLFVLGADLRVRRANPAARREFGGQAAAALRHPTLSAAVDRALAEGAPQTADLLLPVPVPREARATVIPLDPASGHGRAGDDRVGDDRVGDDRAGDDGASDGRVLVLLADRTRERAAERTRADFVTNASHELRTPLAGLIGLIETLRGPAADDPAAQRRFLGIAADQAARMHRLVEALLDLSRVEMTQHRRPTDRVDLAELAESVAAGFEPGLRARGAALHVAADPAPPPVLGDADQLAQVVQNLLDNALRHGGEGVHIRLTAEAAPPGERWPARPGVVLAVADDGPGVAREHIPRLTERFYRVDKGRSRATGGTGLGLAIVKHIVNRHRGQLRIESAAGTGTTVRVWLPAA